MNFYFRIYLHLKTGGIRCTVHLKLHIRTAHATKPFLEIPKVQGPQIRSPWLEYWVLLQVGRPDGVS